MALVAGLFAGLGLALGHVASSETASLEQDALMVDLPPVEAASHRLGDEAPPQEAAQASAGAQAPRPKAPDAMTPPKPPTPTNEKVPEAPDPAAVLEQPATPPPQVRAAAAPQDAHQPGAPTHAQADAEDADSTEPRRAAAHLFTLWQKALVGRLQAARHGLATAHVTGITKVAFAIDREGRLVSAHVAHGSGSAAVDAAALGLVRRAAPFPTPPAGARETELSFVVPISFRRGD